MLRCGADRVPLFLVPLAEDLFREMVLLEGLGQPGGGRARFGGGVSKVCDASVLGERFWSSGSRRTDLDQGERADLRTCTAARVPRATALDRAYSVRMFWDGSVLDHEYNSLGTEQTGYLAGLETACGGSCGRDG